MSTYDITFITTALTNEPDPLKPRSCRLSTNLVHVTPCPFSSLLILPCPSMSPHVLSHPSSYFLVLPYLPSPILPLHVLSCHSLSLPVPLILSCPRFPSLSLPVPLVLPCPRFPSLSLLSFLVLSLLSALVRLVRVQRYLFSGVITSQYSTVQYSTV